MDQLKDAYSIRHAQLLHLEELLILLETPPFMRGMNSLFDRKMLMAFVGIPFLIFVLTSIMEGFYWERLRDESGKDCGNQCNRIIIKPNSHPNRSRKPYSGSSG